MPYMGRSNTGFGIRDRFQFTAAGSETSVSGSDDNGRTLKFSDGKYVDVYLNGVYLDSANDYNTTTANTIGGITALAANDYLEVVSYDIFSVADVVPATGGTFSGNVTAASNFTVSGDLTVTGNIIGDIEITGTTPSLTIGDAGAEDSKLVFDGNAQDFYIALDDSADDLLIGLGSAVGTTPAIAIDENLLVTTHGGITMAGTTPTLTIGDAGAEDTKIVFDGNAQDFYIALDDSADDLLIGLGSTVGTTPAIAIDENLLATFHGGITMAGTTPTLTIGDAGAEDTKIVFDGNAQDFYIGLDDSADDLLIGLGSAVGTTPAISIDENLAISTFGDITMTGTTPTLTIGDAGAEDAKIVFDGNAQDFYIGLDDSADDLVIGKGSALGTTPAISIDENLKTQFGGGAVGKTSTANATGSTTLDYDANQNFVLTATGNITLANPSTETVGQTGFIAIIQDGTGSRTLTLGTDYESPASGGITLTTTANATDVLPYVVIAANRVALGTPQLAFG
jgi:hypothetical protein|tara:strand:- start:139 stop:1668 length:1530 start_codon:yes stop_codon:yes gene_type:complete